MTFKEFEKIGDVNVFPFVRDLYGLDGYEARPIDRGYEICEGQNAVYCCEKEGEDTKILRISLNDRSREDLMAEAEYIRYLYENSGSVSNVITSRNGNLFEEITVNNVTCFINLFEKAKGKKFDENGYRYRKGVPITEHHYIIGKTLGKLHQLSKEYVPVHRRYSFLDKHKTEYINQLIPDSYALLKSKLNGLLKGLEEFGFGREVYGMIHFDYNDSNYSIDFETGQITVYDFDNSCFGWYMYDLAYVWMYAVGWIQQEKEPVKRKTHMDDFFKTVLEGYRSETELEERLAEKLPFFINAVILDLIVEAFEYIQKNGEEPDYDFDLSYLIKCIEDDISYMGFFHEIYSSERPFEYGEDKS